MALGPLGMTLGDFESLTPDEFAAVWRLWRDGMEQRERGEWERTRMECCCILQPYSSGPLRPGDVMRFPWDDAPAESGPREELSREELLERYRAAKAAAGLI